MWAGRLHQTGFPGLPKKMGRAVLLEPQRGVKFAFGFPHKTGPKIGGPLTDGSLRADRTPFCQALGKDSKLVSGVP